MGKLGFSAVMLIAAVLAVTGSAWSDSDEGKKKAEMAAAAKVPIDQAIKAASDKAPGKVIEAELEHKHGKIVWEIEVVTAEGKTVEVHVDADSGAVIDTEEEKPEVKKPAKKKAGKK